MGFITAPHFLAGLAIVQAVLTSVLIVIFLVLFSTQAGRDAAQTQAQVESNEDQIRSVQDFVVLICDEMEAHRDRNETVHALIPLIAADHGINTNVEPLPKRRDPCGTSRSQ